MTGGPALALFAVVGLVLAGLSGSHAPPVDKRYQRLEAIVARARAGAATAAELREGAELARQLGQDETAQRLDALADALDRRAQPLAPIGPEDIDEPTGDAPTPAPAPADVAPVTSPVVDEPAPDAPVEPALMPPMTSPIPEATDEQWAQFVRTMGSGHVDTVTKSYNLGIFRFGMPTLEALGIVSHVRKGRAPARGAYDGGHNVWIGDWIPPHTVDSFLRDPALQYRLFERNVAALEAWLRAKHGAEIEAAAGQRGTASGLLAVALVAGPRGWEKWWREWQPGGPPPSSNTNTAYAFKVANGLF